MDTAQQFSLRWNMYSSNLTECMHELYNKADLVDVTLAVEGRLLRAHKLVLSICSNYFKEIFKSNPCEHPVVILNEVVYENMKNILEFMYNGEVNVSKGHLTSFLQTAELLQVKGLTENAENDSSETSSGKDDRLDNLDENEDDSEVMNYNQLVDSDVELPPQYSLSQSLATSQQQQYSSSQISTPQQPHSSTQSLPSSQQQYSLNQSLSTSQQQYTSTPRVPTPTQLTSVNLTSSKRQLKTENGGSKSKRSKSETTVNHNGKNNNKKSQNKQINDQEHGNGISWKVENCDLIQTSELINENITTENISIQLDEMKEGTNTLDNSKDNSVANSSGEANNDNGKSEAQYTKHNYQCSTCAKKFSRRDHLRTHEKNIHGEDAGPFTCMFCSQIYKNAESLRKHMAKFHSYSECHIRTELQV